MDNFRHIEGDIHLRGLFIAYKLGRTVAVSQHAPLTLPHLKVILSGSLRHLFAHIAHSVPRAVCPIAVSANQVLHMWKVAYISRRTFSEESIDHIAAVGIAFRLVKIFPVTGFSKQNIGR